MKDWTQFLIAVVLACAVWFLHNMSRRYSDIVNVPVTVQSNIDGRAGLSAEPVVVSARCQTSGYRLLELRRAARKGKTVTVEIDPTDFVYVEGDDFSIDDNNLSRYAHDIFGDGVTLQSFVAPKTRFRFLRENCRKVPVRAVRTVEFRSEYTAMDDMVLSPDSVLVYGEPLRLQSIECVLTRPFTLKNVRSAVHGVVKLEHPSGVRLSSSEVTYSQNVTRYVEVRERVTIGSRNAPSGVDFSVFPSTAEVTYRCVFPLITDPASLAEFYVDYRDFENSVKGKCVVKCDGLPQGVIDWKIEPQVCECVERREVR